MDADEFLQKYSVAEFMQELKKSVHIIDFHIRKLWDNSKEFNDALKKSLVVQSLLPLIEKIEDRVLQREMIKFVSDRLRVSEESVSDELGKLKRKHLKIQERRKNNEPSASSLKTLSPLPSIEEEILLIVLQSKSYLTKISQLIEAGIEFENHDVAECINILQQNSNIDAAQLLQTLSPAQAQWLRERMLRQMKSSATLDQVFNSLLERWVNRYNERKLKLLSEKAAFSLNQGLQSAELNQFQKLLSTVKGFQKSI